MFGNFTEEARKVLSLAKIEMKNLKHPYVSSEHLLLGILKDHNSIQQYLVDKITYEQLKTEVIAILGIGEKESDYFLYTPLLKRIIENAVLDSKENNKGYVTVEHLFSSLLEEGEGVAIRILLGMNINIDELYQKFSYKLIHKKNKKNRKLFLEEIGVNLNKRAEEGYLDPAVGREVEINRMMEILSRKNKNNPLLVGDAGVGKTAIVEELARRIVLEDVPSFLRHKTIISLDMASCVAGTKYRGEFEDRVRKIIAELEDNEDIILFIDEIHTIVGAGGAEGAIDASNIFKPALARGKMKCIGATTFDEYKKFMEKDKALERRFQRISIEEADEKKVKQILKKVLPIYEQYHQVIFPENLLKDLQDLSAKYIFDRKEPDRSIDILDEVCARVHLKETDAMKDFHQCQLNLKEVMQKKKDAITHHNFELATIYKEEENRLESKMNALSEKFQDVKKEVHKKDIALVISEKTGVPVYEVLKDHKKTLYYMQKTLSEKIIGQEEAIKSLMKIAARLKLGYTDHKCYSILFTGPSGVGKTALSKIFGEQLVGEKNVMKLDMSEYAEAHSISKLIGSPPGYVGYEDHVSVFESIKKNPFSVIIVDEIEKAHPSILHLFYQILDDSKIKDSRGNVIHFDHTIIVMTSNIGFLKGSIGFQKNQSLSSKVKENLEIPFVNRVDQVVEFQNLKKCHIQEIIQRESCWLRQKYPEVLLSRKEIEEFIQKSDYEHFGARKIKKMIKDHMENKLLDQIFNKDQRILKDFTHS